MQRLSSFRKIHHPQHFLTLILRSLSNAMPIFIVLTLFTSLTMTSLAMANTVNQFYQQLSSAELQLAESVVQKSIELEPNNYKLQQDLAYIQYYSGNLDAALASFQSLATIVELQGNAQVFYGLALVQHELELSPESLKSIISAYTLLPENYEIVKLYADISHKLNLHQTTLEEHDKQENIKVAIPETPDHDGTFNFKNALSDYKNNNIAAARTQLEALLAENPDDIDAMVLLAFIFYREGNSIEAEKLFSELANRENFDENSDVLYGLALSQRNLGKTVDAFENVLRAIVAETSREDLKALYRSLAVVLTTEAEADKIAASADTVTESTESNNEAISLSDIIADVTKSENFDSNQ